MTESVRHHGAGAEPRSITIRPGDQALDRGGRTTRRRRAPCGQQQMARRWGGRSPAAVTWWCRPAPAPASPWPTWSRRSCPASGWWWPPPPRRSRTSWPPRTSPGGRRHRAGLSFAVLKGRSNYLCRQRVVEVGGGGEQLTLAGGAGDGAPTPPSGTPTAAGGLTERRRAASADQVRRLVRWAAEPPTGDRAELEFEPALPGLGHGLDHRPRVPGRIPVPLGQRLLRRARPGPGRRRRRGGGQHPSLRGPPGQRGRGPPAPRGGRLRRGPRGRGGHDRQPWASRSGRAGSGPWPPRLDGLARRPVPTPSSRPWPRWATSSNGSSGRWPGPGCPGPCSSARAAPTKWPGVSMPSQRSGLAPEPAGKPRLPTRKPRVRMPTREPRDWMTSAMANHRGWTWDSPRSTPAWNAGRPGRGVVQPQRPFPVRARRRPRRRRPQPAPGRRLPSGSGPPVPIPSSAPWSNWPSAGCPGWSMPCAGPSGRRATTRRRRPAPGGTGPCWPPATWPAIWPDCRR